MQRRKFSCEFKLEAIRLVRERGVTFAQAAPDLDVNVNMPRGGPRSLILIRSTRSPAWGR